jgi:hypothetical protein
LLLLAGLLSACGSSTKEPAALVPPRALFYAEANLAPEGDQRAAVDALARKFPGSGNAGQRLGRLLDQGARQKGSKVSFSRDVEPWLGDKVAAFAGQPARGSGRTPGAALVATEDEQQALEAVQKQSGPGSEAEYQGVQYRRFSDGEVAGTLDGFLVLGEERGFRAAVDASKGDAPLESSERFKRALEGAATDRLGFVYVDPAAALSAVPSTRGQFLAPLRRAFRDPLVATASAESDALEATSLVPESQLAAFGLSGLANRGSALLDQMPGDSVAATGGPELGRQLGGVADLLASSFGGRAILEAGLRQQTGLDLQRDLLGWMGDYAVFARGRDVSSLGGALVVETKDPAATRRAISGLRAVIGRRSEGGELSVGRLAVRGADAGFSVRKRGLRAPIDVFLRDDRFVVAYGAGAAAQAIRPSSRLEDNSQFTQAAAGLGPGFNVSTFLSVPGALRLAEGAGASRDPDFVRARPYFEPLGALVGATKPADAGRLETRFRLAVPG